MANIIENLFVYTDIFSNFLPILVFGLCFSKSKNVLGILIILAYVVSNLLINGLITVDSDKNFGLYESQTLIEYLLFSWFIYSQLKRTQAKRLNLLLGILFIIFVFVYLKFIKKEDGFDSIPIGVEAILILGFSFYYLYERMNDTTTLFIYNTYQFWIILGIVLYLAGGFFIYVFTDYLRLNNNNGMLSRLWTVTNVFAIIRNILFSVAILMHAKPSKETTQYYLDVSRLN